MQEINIGDILKVIENKRVLAAVSGGADSMVMLNQLVNLLKYSNFYMEIIHVNHNLRGVESDGDSAFVEAQAKKMQIPCKIVSVDVKKYKNENKQTIEQAARELRYKAINDYKEEGKFDFIVIAHNLDDQAETVLMHLCRGSGLKGASGITQRDGVLRPLISFTKSEILKYAEDNKITFREDSTNSNKEYTRNYIRHEILPRLEEIYPSVKKNLCKFAEIAKSDDEFIENIIDTSKMKICRNCISIHVSAFDEKEPYYSRLIYKAVNYLGIWADVEQKHVKLIKNLSFMKNGAYLCLPHGINAYKEYDYVTFSFKLPKNLQNNYVKYEIGNLNIQNVQIEIKEVSTDDVVFGDNILFFNADAVPYDAVFRYRENGDVFHKLNSGTKKFSDYLTDKKIPLKERDNIIVLASGNKILLALGLDISDDVKITSDTIRIAKISYKKN